MDRLEVTMHRRDFVLSGLVFLAALVWLGTPDNASAYARWGDGCTDCHGSFLNSTSTKPNNTWPSSKHNVHRRTIISDTGEDYCGLCHVSNGDDPLLNESRGETGFLAVGCMGCHGVDPDPGTANNLWWGAGLRLHHANANVGTDNGGLSCVDCHDDDPAPLGEDAVPIYYGGTDINVLDPCNGDGSENWTPDGLGLDNDGDLDYDAADSDCSTSAAIFSDGFESGDLSAWSSTVP